MKKGLVIRSTGSWYTVAFEDGSRAECRLKGNFRIKGVNTRNTNPIAVGDHVDIETDQNGDANIVYLHDRKNYIIRRSTKLSKQTHIIAANLDRAWVMATLHNPRTSTGFIDRFLVTAEAYGIPASVIFNKSDLLDEEETEYVNALMDLYRHLGYTCWLVNSNDAENVQQLRNEFAGRVNLIAGHSGVGKSTLINAIEPGLRLKTGEISKAHSKGMHTTTFAEMFPLQNGGWIIDTPGIKELGIINIEKNELSHFFPEMRALFGQCKYHGCLHNHEPGCAVRDAVEKSRIAVTRYECYLQILNGEELDKEYD
jgi:ribosome biogenesis GTPase / thiamine phosphate phosphatase